MTDLHCTEVQLWRNCLFNYAPVAIVSLLARQFVWAHISTHKNTQSVFASQTLSVIMYLFIYFRHFPRYELCSASIVFVWWSRCTDENVAFCFLLPGRRLSYHATVQIAISTSISLSPGGRAIWARSFSTMYIISQMHAKYRSQKEANAYTHRGSLLTIIPMPKTYGNAAIGIFCIKKIQQQQQQQQQSKHVKTPIYPILYNRFVLRCLAHIICIFLGLWKST